MYRHRDRLCAPRASAIATSFSHGGATHAEVDLLQQRRVLRARSREVVWEGAGPAAFREHLSATHKGGRDKITPEAEKAKKKMRAVEAKCEAAQREELLKEKEEAFKTISGEAKQRVFGCLGYTHREPVGSCPVAGGKV